jgi:glycerophosphoryl diester phosphodiesterase
MTLQTPKLIAHRGASKASPENTIASLRTAQSQGATWVECDVQLTADQQAVIIHDETLDRTTNGKGRVSGLSFADLAEVDAGQGQHIPTLKCWIKVAAELELGLNLELKANKQQAKVLAEIVYHAVQQYYPQTLPVTLISAGTLQCLQAYRALDAKAPLAWVVSRLPWLWRKQVKRLGLSAIVINYKSLTQKKIQQCHDMGCQVFAYTVNEVAVAEQLFQWGVDAVFTDDLPLLKQACSKTRCDTI